jgi:alpha-glucosidase
MLAIMMTALTGTLFIYQGQEIGMINVPKDWPIENFKDIESVNFYKATAVSTNNDKEALDYVMRSLQILGRDNARLPMQWDSSPFAGFTDSQGGAWMRVHDLYPEINVAKQLEDPESTYSFWKSMIRIRKEFRDVLVHGIFEMFEPENEQTFVFAKKHGDQTAVVALNFTSKVQRVELPLGGLTFRAGNYLESKAVEEAKTGRVKELRPWEGRLYMRDLAN